MVFTAEYGLKTRQVASWMWKRRGVLYGTHETANLKSDEMWPYNPETRAKFATMKNMKKEGYQEGLLEIEEKHQNAAVEAMEEVNNVAPLGRIEEVMMKEPSESDVVEAGCCAAKSTTANVHKMHKKYEMLTFAVLLPENLGWS